MSHKYGVRKNGASNIQGNAGLTEGEEVGTLGSRFVILGKLFNLQASISFIQLALRTHRYLKHSTSCIDNDVVGDEEKASGVMGQHLA